MSKQDNVRTIGLRAARRRTLRFGLIAVEVGTGPALDTSARVKGTLITAEGERVKQVYRTVDTGAILERSDLVTAYEHEGAFVTMEKHELESLSETGDSTVELVANLAADEVPSEWIQSTALTWPSDTANDQGYVLLAAALRKSGRVLIGRAIEGGTTKVLAIRWSDVYGCLVAQTLAYAAQVRGASVNTIAEGLAKIEAPSDELVGMAEKLIDGIADDFAWDEVRDVHGERMAEAIAEKAESGSVTIEAPAAPAGSAPDLLAALKASLEAVA